MSKASLLNVFVFGFAILPFTIAHSSVLQVTESEGDRSGYNNEKVELFFSVYNTYNDILEFAVGNNGAYSAGYRADLAQTPTAHLVEAFVVNKDNGSWKTPDGRELTWMNQAANFNSFNTAFLYTSKCGDCSGFNGFLEVGTTDGYSGDAVDPQSPFAAFSESSGVITGLTNIPVPAAIWLFGSGLLGLIGIARRKKST